jgi:hypothetical protein
VVEVDFYHANQLLPLPDEVIVDRVLNKYLAGCEPSFRGATVVDSSVLRFKGAVTLFGPGSHQVTRVCGLVSVLSLWAVLFVCFGVVLFGCSCVLLFGCLCLVLVGSSKLVCFV